MLSRRQALCALGAFAAGGRLRGLAASADLPTRRLGRTERYVTPLALGGVGGLQLNGCADPPDIIVRAVELGVNYLDTANSFGDSQLYYGTAFRRLNLAPGAAGYDAALRERLFIVSKTQLRISWDRIDLSRRTVADDLKRSLTQMFGDGQGAIPDGAYLDCFEFQDVATQDDVDQIYLALDQRDNRNLTHMGGLAALLDFRDGTDYTGLNPGLKKYIRHIGLSGFGSLSLMEAIRRDETNLFDTLQVTLNANDRLYLSTQNNVIPLAIAHDMGVVAIKAFSAGAMYALSTTQLYTGVGGPSEGTIPYANLIRYPLNIPGVATLAVGIGKVHRQTPAQDQLVADLAAAVMDPLSRSQMLRIERDVAYSSGTHTNDVCQAAAVGLQQPVEVNATLSGGRVTVQWSTAIAGADPIRCYEIWSGDSKIVAALPYTPQTTTQLLSTVIPASELVADTITVRAVTSSPYPVRRRW